MVELITLIIVILDQLTKQFVKVYLPSGTRVPVIDGFFYLEQTRNRGAAWGFLHGHEWGIYFLTGISILAVIGLYWITRKTKPGWIRLALSFIVGGALGNLIDRIFLGEVVDFLAFYFGSYSFPYFNIADSFITIGAVLMFALAIFKPSELDAIWFLRENHKPKKTETVTEDGN